MTAIKLFTSRSEAFMAARDRMQAARRQLGIATAAGLTRKVTAAEAELKEAASDYHAYLL